MTRRLVVTYFTITALALASLAIPLGITFAHREKDRLLFAIERDADAMASEVQVAVATAKPPPRTAILVYAARTGGRVIVVDTEGITLLDTQYPNGPAHDFSTRPEIITALAGNRVEGTRHSSTLHTGLIYAAVPIAGGTDVSIKGALRITYPSATLDARVRRIRSQLALLCLVVLVVVLAVGWFLARSVTRPVRRLEEAANRVAGGELSTRVPDQRGPPELQHLVSAFNRMASEIGRLLEAQQQFVADASHQLRTPLTALRLRLENLDATAADSERPAIGALVADVTRLSRLVDGLLVLARGDAGGVPAQAVDVSEIARSRAEAWSDVVGERGVELIVDAPREAWAAVVPGAVEQLVDNLVDNALAVSRSGDAVTVRVVAVGSVVELHVLDQGPGLTPDARARAFDRFWRAADAPPGGSGLGLSIVRRLAEASDGSARLDERSGGGIDAVVSLPATRLAPAPR
jgi:signal transduction histidine kinase